MGTISQASAWEVNVAAAIIDVKMTCFEEKYAYMYVRRRDSIWKSSCRWNNFTKVCTRIFQVASVSDSEEGRCSFVILNETTNRKTRYRRRWEITSYIVHLQCRGCIDM